MNAEQNSGRPSLCRNGCGFFSGVDTKGLCSVCFKEFVKKDKDGKEAKEEIDQASSSLAEMHMGAAAASVASQANLSSPVLEKLDLSEKRSSVVDLPNPLNEEPAEAKSRVEVQDAPDSAEGKEAANKCEPEQPPKKKKNKCLVCKKKLGLTGFSCRCGGLFCGIHRYSDKHECNFDYKAMGEKEIAEANPLVVAQKVAKI